MKLTICILCAGTWGTSLAKVLSVKYNVIVWDRSEKNIDRLNTYRVHKNLPGIIIPDNIIFTSNIDFALEDADIIIFACPFIALKELASKIQYNVVTTTVLISLCKGMDADTFLTSSQILKQYYPDNSIIAMSGPSHAEEVAMDIPTSLIVASEDLINLEYIKNLFNIGCLSISTSTDIYGVELCGALKNVIAIACGIAIGKGGGNNTIASIITSGLNDIRLIGKYLNCNDETFLSVAGIGDLIVTGTCNYSRNFTAGKLLGSGLQLDDVKEKIGMTIEGINAFNCVKKLEDKFNIKLPTLDSVEKYLI